MTSHARFALPLICLLTVLAAPRSADAETIDWGFDSPFPSAVDNFDSFGNALDASYSFSLGAFNAIGAFTPTRSNVGSWALNWTELDNTAYNDALHYFSDSTAFTNNDTFAVGTQAYIWGTGPGDEAILLTSTDWLFPAATPLGPGTEFFQLVNGGADDINVEVVVGAIDSTYSGLETGISFDASGGGGFDLQTEAVPEPASALFFSISAIWFLFRRPRRATS